MRTAHNVIQRGTRLIREIHKFQTRIREIGEPTTPQQRRTVTLARHKLSRLYADLIVNQQRTFEVLVRLSHKIQK